MRKSVLFFLLSLLILPSVVHAANPASCNNCVTEDQLAKFFALQYVVYGILAFVAYSLAGAPASAIGALVGALIAAAIAYVISLFLLRLARSI